MFRYINDFNNIFDSIPKTIHRHPDQVTTPTPMSMHTPSASENTNDKKSTQPHQDT